MMRSRQIVAVAALFLRRAAFNPFSLAGIFLLPIVIALIFGTADERALSQMPIGVFVRRASTAGTAYLAALDREPGVEMARFPSESALERAVTRADVAAGIEMDGGSRPSRLIGSSRDPIFSAARGVVLSTAARGDATFDPASHRVSVAELATTKKARATGLNRAAAGMLVFFVFVNACFASAILTEDRARGVLQRTASGPVPVNAITAGEMFGRFLFAVVQGALVAIVSAVVLDATWGAALPFGIVLAAVSCVAAGTSVLLGVLIRRPGPEAASLSLAVAAILGFLGGCFWSLRYVPRGMQIAALFTPHAWALRAMDTLAARGAGLHDIALDLMMLGLFAVAVLVVSGFALGRAVVATDGAR